jgi:hypothetical protein
MKLTEHFLDRELRVEAQIAEIQEIARWGCEHILEPIRTKFGPLVITSGYRDADRNKNTGGVDKSFHLYPSSPTPRGAADVYPPEADHSHSPDRVVRLFDWLRLESGLPFDKVILEYSGATPEVVHIQWYVLHGVSQWVRPRTAWVGKTHGAGEYTAAECRESKGDATCANA